MVLVVLQQSAIVESKAFDEESQGIKALKKELSMVHSKCF